MSPACPLPQVFCLSALLRFKAILCVAKAFYSLVSPPAGRRFYAAFQKGGVPAAPSGTATLLRLSPSHLVRPRRRPPPTSGARGSHGLTGGVYKARERIHRAMADARLLANPASWSRVADSNPN